MPENITPPHRDRSHRALVARMDRRERERAQVDPQRGERLNRAVDDLRGRPYVPGADLQPPWMVEPGAERFGGEPPVGTVLRWTERGYEGRIFVAVRDAEGWDTTGSMGRCTWADLATRLAERPDVSVAIDWRPIPAPEPEPSGDDAVRDWAARFLPDATPRPIDPQAFADDVLDPDGANRDVMARRPAPPLRPSQVADQARRERDTMADESARDTTAYTADRDVDARTAQREAPGPMIDTRPAGERD